MEATPLAMAGSDTGQQEVLRHSPPRELHRAAVEAGRHRRCRRSGQGVGVGLLVPVSVVASPTCGRGSRPSLPEERLGVGAWQQAPPPVTAEGGGDAGDRGGAICACVRRHDHGLELRAMVRPLGCS
jgi:hypothetical protein